MKRSSYVLPSILLLTVASCSAGNTEEEELGVSLAPLFFSAAETFESGSRALQGSRACVDIGWYKDQDGAWKLLGPSDWEACYDATWSGAPLADACTVLEAPGERVVELTPRGDCRWDGLAGVAVPDRFRLQVVGTEGLQGRLEWWQEHLAELYLVPGPRGSFPSDWIPPIGEPLRLVPDVEVVFPVVLVDATGERVAWDFEQGRLLEYREGAAAREITSSEGDELFPVSIGAGERSTLALALPGVELPVAAVEATPVDHAASLELTVAYDPGGEPERWAAPYAARAVVRDAEGHVMLGAPVEWTLVEGHLAVISGDRGVVIGPSEYVSIADACVPPPSAPEPRRATLRVELGSLVDEVELEWTAFPEEEPSDEPFEADPACQRAGDAEELESRGCRCTTQPAGAAGWLAWGLVVLGAALRRRRVVGA
jgi:MYXO-CTERM domain-containing protein